MLKLPANPLSKGFHQFILRSNSEGWMSTPIICFLWKYFDCFFYLLAKEVARFLENFAFFCLSQQMHVFINSIAIILESGSPMLHFILESPSS